MPDLPPNPTTPQPSDNPKPVRAKLEAAFVYEIETPLSLGCLAPWQMERMAHETRIRVFYKRCIAWVIGLCLATWLGLATALFTYVKHQQGFSTVRFVTILLLPFRIEEYRQAKAEYFVTEGLAAAEESRWRDALDLLRIGQPRVPTNLKARITLAQIYLYANRPDLAIHLLVEGLPYYADQVEYARGVFGYLFQQRLDTTILDVTGELLKNTPNGTPLHALLVGARATALFNLDRFTECQAFLAEKNVLSTPEAKLIVARIDWEAGRETSALLTLRKLVEERPDDLESYQTLQACLRAAGDHAEYRRLALARQIAQPDHPQAYVDFLEACVALKDPQAHARASADFLARFSTDPAALALFAEHAVRLGRPDLSASALAAGAALEKGRPELRLCHVRALLRARAYDEAHEASAPINVTSEWNPLHTLQLQGLHLVADAAKGKLGGANTAPEPNIQPILDSPYLRADMAAGLAKEFLAIQSDSPTARRLLTRALELDLLHPGALDQLIRLELAAKDGVEIMPLLQRLPQVRKPSIELMQTMRRQLESDLFVLVPGRQAVLAQLEHRERVR